MLQNQTTNAAHGRAGRSIRGIRRRGNSGASLIEIMVVLVILLVGVFLAIRIFPTGFATLQATDNRSRATRLAQKLLGEAQGNVTNLPAGVLFAYPDASNNNNLVAVTDQDPDNLRDYFKTPGNPYYSDINKTRYIKGEPVKIPLPGSSGSTYFLRFGPIYMDPTVGDPTADPASNPALFNSYLAVNSGALIGYSVPSAGGSNFASVSASLQGPATYLIDYGGDGGTAYIMFSPRPANGGRTSTARNFTASYSYQAANGAIVPVYNVALNVGDAGTPTWQTIPNGGGNAQNIVPGSLVVTRAFDRLKASEGFDPSEPYQYHLVTNNVAGTNANLGVLQFNPAGANVSQQTPNGERAFMGYVDYSVLDWHIIRDDVEIPQIGANNVGLVPVKLTLDVIKRLGDANFDNTTYAGIYGSNNPAGQNDIDVIDLATGAVLNGSGNVVRGVATPAVSGAGPDYYIDTDARSGTYSTGTIYVNPLRLKPGAQIRVLYKGDGDWGVAMQKAYSQYTPEIAGGAVQTRPAVGSFSTYGVDMAATSIWFPLCDLNKSVTVTLQVTQANGDVVRLAPTQMTIDQPDVANGYAWIKVAPYLPTGTSAWSVAGTITGVSVKARVIWKDENRTNTTGPTNGWRVQDLDTYLTPGA